MGNKFEPTKQTFNNLFEQPTSRYIIPKYQREYSWKKQQLEEYWKLIDSEDEIFLGTMIFHIDDNVKDKEIIDGQQRYITTIIASASLRDVLLEKYKETGDISFNELAKDIQNDYIGKRKSGTNQYQNFLEPGLTTVKYFKDEIQFFDDNFINSNVSVIEKIKLKSNTSEELLIIDAYKFFKEKWVNSINSSSAISVFHHFKNRLDKWFVIRIEIDDYDLAFDIFESVNDQGLRLGVSDLIKNQILKYLPNTLSDQSKGVEKWNEMISYLGEVKITAQEFLRYYWASKYGYISDKQLYKNIKHNIEVKFAKNWNSFLETIRAESEVVKNIYTYSLQDWVKSLEKQQTVVQKFDYSINVLRNIKAKTWLVLILSIIRNQKKLNSLKVDYISHIEKIQKFTFLYFTILGSPGNWYFDLIWRTAIKIENAKNKQDYTDIFNNLFKEFSTKLNISEDVFAESFLAIKYKADSESKFIISVIFAEIEMKIKGTKHITWNQSIMNIEHILPQEPKNWKLKSSEIKNHVNLLGNLVLIPYSLNGQLGNLSCSDKMKILKTALGDMKIVDEIFYKCETGEWPFDKINKKDFSAIINRQDYLCALGYQIWVKDFRKKLGY